MYCEVVKLIKCNLDEIMVKKGVKMRDIAKSTGISRTTLTALYYNHTKGVQFDTLDKICTYLNIEPGQLFTQFKFELNVISVYDTKKEGAYYLECQFVTDYGTLVGLVICDYDEESNKFKVAIWKNLLYSLEVVPNSILIQLLMDYYQEKLTTININSASKEILISEDDFNEPIDVKDL